MVAFLSVEHCDDNLRASCAEVHSTAHTCNLLAGYDPVSKISVFSNFHSTENGSLNVSASYETEGLCCIEVFYSWNGCYVYAAGVDDINVNIGSICNCVDACESVFRVECNCYAIRNVVSNHSRKTDP